MLNRTVILPNPDAPDTVKITPFTEEEEEQWRAMQQKYEEQVKASRIPQVVSIRQAELALMHRGLLEEVEAFIQTLPLEHQVEWRRTTEVRRSHQLVKLVQQEKGYSDEQLDQLFLEASAL